MKNLLAHDNAPAVIGVAIAFVTVVLIAVVVAKFLSGDITKKFTICSGPACIHTDAFSPMKDQPDCIAWENGALCGDFLIIQNHD